MVKSKRQHILAIILYALPIVFFIISYFWLTVSGEDVHQGAGNLRDGVELNFWRDITGAFSHSGRITDSYAWTVIDLFDYQFRFGVDTIFRLIDVLMISGVLYLSTWLALGARPRLTLRDALVWCGIFVAIVWSPFGRRLYSEFSMIHNYVPLALITLLFAMPYVRLALGRSVPRKWWMAILMLICGMLLGLATTVTPLAMILTIIIYSIIVTWKHRQWFKPPAWFYTGITGALAGFCISFFGSGGMSGYETGAAATAFDYVALSQVFQNLPKLLWHLIYNFGLILVPLLAIFGICLIFKRQRRKFFLNTSLEQKKVLLMAGIFVVIHVFGTIQIKVEPRILIPAYIVGVIAILNYLKVWQDGRALQGIVIMLTILAVALHAVFLGIYHERMAIVLERIKNTEGNAACVTHAENIAPRIPLMNLSQEFMVVDWGYPEIIYNKAVMFCPE